MFFLNKKEQLVIIMLLLAILIIASFMFVEKYMAKKSEAVNVVLTENTEEKAAIDKVDTLDIYVHVSGRVRNPGVYSLKTGERIIDAINKAGGALPDADLDALNLAQKLHDEDKIYVPKKGELNNNNHGTNYNNSGKININTASAAELEKLPGIGETLAQRIVEYREKYGKFQKIEDIMKVSRIGPKIFEQIKDMITVN